MGDAFGELERIAISRDFIDALPRQIRHRSIVVDDDRKTGAHAIEHRGRGFAPRFGSQLNRQIGGGKPRLVNGTLDMAGDFDRNAGRRVVDEAPEFGAISLQSVADENEPRIFSDCAARPGLDDKMAQFERREQAEAADEEFILADAQPPPRRGSVQPMQRGAQKRQDADRIAHIVAEETARQRLGMGRMQNNAPRVAENETAQGQAIDHGSGAAFALQQQAGQAMRAINLVGKFFPRQVSVGAHPFEQITEIDIVKNHDPREAVDEIDHVRVIGGVTDRIDDPVIVLAILFEPGKIAPGEIGEHPGIRDMGAGNHAFDVVVAGEFTQQLGGMVGDAGLVTRKRREESQGRPPRDRVGFFRRRATLLVKFLESVDRSARRFGPGEARRPLRPRLGEVAAEIRVLDDANDLSRQRVGVAGIEQRVGASHTSGRLVALAASTGAPQAMPSSAGSPKPS